MPYVLPDGQRVEDSDGAKFFSAHADDTISFGPYALGRSSEDFLTLHGITWEDAPAKTVSRADMQKRVQGERKRRLELGFNYDFGLLDDGVTPDPRGIHEIGTTEADWVGWSEVINLANALIDVGDTTSTIDIVTNTGPASVTAPEWQAIMLAGAADRQVIWAKSFELQAMDPIPEDYADDSFWS